MRVYFIYCILAPWIMLQDPASYEGDGELSDDGHVWTVGRTGLPGDAALFETGRDARAWIDVLDAKVHARGKVQLAVGYIDIPEGDHES